MIEHNNPYITFFSMIFEPTNSRCKIWFLHSVYYSSFSLINDLHHLTQFLDNYLSLFLDNYLSTLFLDNYLSTKRMKLKMAQLKTDIGIWSSMD